ncbi:MAG: hypothetical protein JWM32_2177 [Verrucomicrobia bacterium]|nr:hypothetical protein [Verrucomicrobiota bacterium]
MQWYYSINGQRLGPVPEAEFERMVRDGMIRPETLVWRQGMKEWQAYSTTQPIAGEGEETETCAVSGKRYPKREMIQFEGKWISAEHRDEFFQRLREGVGQPMDFTYGNVGRRFCAKLIDGIIGGVIGVSLNMIVAMFVFGSANYFPRAAQGYSAQKQLLFQVITTPLGILVGLAYAVFFISRFDATPGKMALGLKIVRPDGSKLSTPRIIGRHFAEWISGAILLIGYIMAGFDDQRRALHDRICDTRVIRVG